MVQDPKRTLDINSLANTPDWEVEVKTAESPEERAHRLSEASLDNRARRRKELWLFFTLLVGVSVVGGASLFASVDRNTSAEDKKWATAMLTSIVSAGVGYLTGKGKG